MLSPSAKGTPGVSKLASSRTQGNYPYANAHFSGRAGLPEIGAFGRNVTLHGDAKPVA